MTVNKPDIFHSPDTCKTSRGRPVDRVTRARPGLVMEIQKPSLIQSSFLRRVAAAADTLRVQTPQSNAADRWEI